MFEHPEWQNRGFRRFASFLIGLALLINLYYYGGAWLHSNGYLTETAMLAVSAITFFNGSILALVTISFMRNG